jgi:hypothetical protein
MPAAPPQTPSQDDEALLARMRDEALRRHRRFWMLRAFLPALVVPVVLVYATVCRLKPLPSGVTHWVDTLLVFSLLLSPVWILFCTFRMQMKQPPDDYGANLGNGCLLFFLLMLGNYGVGAALLFGACATLHVLLR